MSNYSHKITTINPIMTPLNIIHYYKYNYTTYANVPTFKNF